MVNGEELRGIARIILNILDGGNVRSLEDLNQLVGMKVPFPNGDVLEVHRGISGSLLNPKQGIKMSYDKPNWGTVINTSSNPEDNFTKFLLKTRASVFGYTPALKDPLGRTIYEQTFPGADFEIVRKELERLTNREYYLTE